MNIAITFATKTHASAINIILYEYSKCTYRSEVTTLDTSNTKLHNISINRNDMQCTYTVTAKLHTHTHDYTDVGSAFFINLVMYTTLTHHL